MSGKAKQEMRIAIYETTDKVVEGSYGDFYNTIKRAEAIESMAKEMARLYCPEKPTKKEFESIWEYELLLSTQKHFKELAEAALEGLLEVEHGK